MIDEFNRRMQGRRKGENMRREFSLFGQRYTGKPPLAVVTRRRLLLRKRKADEQARQLSAEMAEREERDRLHQLLSVVSDTPGEGRAAGAEETPEQGGSPQPELEQAIGGVSAETPA